jgi:hypothetical protein
MHLVIPGILVVMVLGIWISARRFEARERRAGRWDDKGPVIETEGPEHRFRNIGMEERLEVIGEWDAPIHHDRRDVAREDPPSTDESRGKQS